MTAAKESCRWWEGGFGLLASFSLSFFQLPFDHPKVYLYLTT